MTFRIQQHIIGLDITMDDALGVDVFQGTAEFRGPESHCVLGETFAGNVESKIATIHEVDNDVADGWLVCGAISSDFQNPHVFNILEGIPQIAQEGMVQMFEHSSFTNNIPYTFRTYN